MTYWKETQVTQITGKTKLILVTLFEVKQSVLAYCSIVYSAVIRLKDVVQRQIKCQVFSMCGVSMIYN